MASKGSSGTGRSSKGAAPPATSSRGPASSAPKSAVKSSGGAAQGAPSASKGGAGSASDGPVSRYQVYKSYGGAQNFAHSHGLRLYNHDDVQEMKDIADAYRWGEYNNH